MQSQSILNLAWFAFLAPAKTFENAEAISKMAIMRRGLDEEFYAEVPTLTYKEGDIYKP